MSFYSDASLVMIPSGYKDQKVYCAKPTDGAADLTFSRATNATRVASNGLIEKVRTNLILQSNTFSTSWNNINSSETSGQPDKDGGNTAWKLVGDTTNGAHYLVQPVGGAPSEVTLSIYAKASGHNFIQLASAQNTEEYANFDLSDGTIGNVGTSFSSAQIQSVGNGWYRISATRTNGGINGFYISLVSSKTAGWLQSWAMPNNTDGFLIQNAQLEAGVLTEFIGNTTTAAVSVGPVSGLPRLDYYDSTCPRLLLEPQRSNVCLWSEQINNAGWAKTNTPTITTNIATAPDGYGGADGIQAADGVNFKTIGQNFIVSANSTVTASVFVKKETSETAWGGIGLVFQGSTTKTFYVPFNAVTGVGVVRGSILTGTIVVDDYGDYWRLMVTTTDNGSNTNLTFSYYGTLSPDGININTGAGSVRTIWGLQVEVGASYATSYIPTLGTSVTRVADVASKTGISSLIGQTEGTIFVEMDFNPYSENRDIIYVGTSAQAYRLVATLGNAIVAGARVSSVSTAYVSSSSLTAGKIKIGFGYKSGDHVLYINGTQIGTSASTSVPTGTISEVNMQAIINGTLAQGVNQTLLFKTRLTNAALAELTSL